MNKKSQISLVNAVGISVVVAIIFFLGGVQARTTSIGQSLSNLIAGDDESSLSADLDYTSVEQLYDVLKREYNGTLSEEDLIKGLKKGLAEATGDPYTVFLTKEENEAFESSLNNEFSGIGAEIAVKNGILQIVAPLEGSPAEEAGLLPGDLIAKIDDQTSEGLSVEEAVTKIRGDDGTVVVLTIVRPGQTSSDISITRATIDIPNAEGEILEGDIGYIDLDTFGEDSVAETTKIAKAYKEQGINKFILDMRGNSGGFLNASVEIAGLWLDNSVVVTQKGKEGDQSLRSGKKGPLFGTELVVLVDGGSASASEIVAGALQDYDAATLVGTQTFGKGSVQTLEKLIGGAILKVTIARWFTPNGNTIDQQGVTPDVEVEYTPEARENGSDPQRIKAIELLRN